MNKEEKPNEFAVSMFEAIRESLKNQAKDKERQGLFRDILKFEAGKTYLVRLVPNVQNPDATIYHYFNHGWNSLATGQFISALCPSTYGETCPIDMEQWKIWRTGTESEKNAAYPLRRKESFATNVYVISDPTNAENEGKVKIMRYGKQLNKIIENAINGDDAEEFGAKIFDLSEKGCNLRIKVESVSEKDRKWTTYVSSRFLSPSAIDGMTKEKIQEIYTLLHKLEDIEPRKTTEELKELLDVHFHTKVNPSDPDWNVGQKSQEPKTSKPDEDDDDIDMTSSKNESKDDNEEINDKKIDDLLKDLQ